MYTHNNYTRKIYLNYIHDVNNCCNDDKLHMLKTIRFAERLRWLQIKNRALWNHSTINERIYRIYDLPLIPVFFFLFFYANKCSSMLEIENHFEPHVISVVFIIIRLTTIVHLTYLNFIYIKIKMTNSCRLTIIIEAKRI